MVDIIKKTFAIFQHHKTFIFLNKAKKFKYPSKAQRIIAIRARIYIKKYSNK